MSTTRIDRIVQCFLQSDGWQFGSSSDDCLSDPQRYDRCARAAEDGADGSTHAEVIQDMREGFDHWIQRRRRSANTDRYIRNCTARSEYPWRIVAAVSAHWDALEAWHLANGTLYQEIG